MRRFIPTVIMLTMMCPGISSALEPGAPQGAPQGASPAAMVAELKGFIQDVAEAADDLTKKGEPFSKLNAMIPAGGVLTPWGANILVHSSSDNSYTVTIQSVPAAVCSLLKIKSRSDVRVNRPCSTSQASDYVYTYTYTDNKNSNLN